MPIAIGAGMIRCAPARSHITQECLARCHLVVKEHPVSRSRPLPLCFSFAVLALGLGGAGGEALIRLCVNEYNNAIR